MRLSTRKKQEDLSDLTTALLKLNCSLSTTVVAQCRLQSSPWWFTDCCRHHITSSCLARLRLSLRGTFDILFYMNVLISCLYAFLSRVVRYPQTCKKDIIHTQDIIFWKFPPFPNRKLNEHFQKLYWLFSPLFIALPFLRRYCQINNLSFRNIFL